MITYGGGGDKETSTFRESTFWIGTKCLATFFSNTNKKIADTGITAWWTWTVLFLICFFCSYLPLPLQWPHTPLPRYTLYTYMLFTQGRGGGRVEPGRRFEGQQFTKLGKKYQHDWMYIQSINSKKTCRKVPLQVNFLDDDILLWCLYR